MEGSLYVATIVFVSNIQLECLPSWAWQLSAPCIFLSWINFMLFIESSQYSRDIRCHVPKYDKILFLRLTPMTLLLILAFGQLFLCYSVWWKYK